MKTIATLGNGLSGFIITCGVLAISAALQQMFPGSNIGLAFNWLSATLIVATHLVPYHYYKKWSAAAK